LAKSVAHGDAFRLGRMGLLALLLGLPGSVSSQRAGAEWTIVERPTAVVAAEQRGLAAALASLKPQRRGTIDAYVVVAALNSDPVFGREARETGRVLSRRFGSEGRTIVLAEGAAAPGSPDSLALALRKIGALADPQEDVVVLYTTSHGSPETGLEYLDPQRGFGSIRPDHLAAMLDASKLANRLIILSACYSGTFLPRLTSARSVVISAAAADRPSFGCSPGNDWTYFGDAFINRALRKPQPLQAAFEEARQLVGQWEARAGLPNSMPQIRIGKDASRWLAPLEKRMPAQATSPVGRSPAAD